MRAEPWGLVRTDHGLSTIRCTPIQDIVDICIRSEVKCTHTAVNTHTPGAVGSQCCGIRGAVVGSVLAQGSHLSCGIEGGREHWLFPPPKDNSCLT